MAKAKKRKGTAEELKLQRRLSLSARKEIRSWLQAQPKELRNKEFARVVARAAVDREFRKSLYRSPAKVLKAEGIPARVATRVKLHDGGGRTVHVILPQLGSGAGRSKLVLTDKELRSGPISWGKDDWTKDPRTADRKKDGLNPISGDFGTDGGPRQKDADPTVGDTGKD